MNYQCCSSTVMCAFYLYSNCNSYYRKGNSDLLAWDPLFSSSLESSSSASLASSSSSGEIFDSRSVFCIFFGMFCGYFFCNCMCLNCQNERYPMLWIIRKVWYIKLLSWGANGKGEHKKPLENSILLLFFSLLLFLSKIDYLCWKKNIVKFFC